MGPRPAAGALNGIRIDEIDGTAALAAALAIRRAVFCDEQGVPESLEIDGHDHRCRHYLVRRDGVPIATARVRTIAPGQAKIERVAVLAPLRGNGIGSRLMRRLLDDLDEAGTATAVLHAQATTEGFYAALGFTVQGAPFDEAGIAHIRMTRSLQRRHD